jgi:hypothetical protein
MSPQYQNPLSTDPTHALILDVPDSDFPQTGFCQTPPDLQRHSGISQGRIAHRVMTPHKSKSDEPKELSARSPGMLHSTLNFTEQTESGQPSPMLPMIHQSLPYA